MVARGSRLSDLSQKLSGCKWRWERRSERYYRENGLSERSWSEYHLAVSNSTFVMCWTTWLLCSGSRACVFHMGTHPIRSLKWTDPLGFVAAEALARICWKKYAFLLAIFLSSTDVFYLIKKISILI